MRTHHHQHCVLLLLCTGWRQCCTTLYDRSTMLCKCTQAYIYSHMYRQWQHVSATVHQHRNVCNAGENMLLISVCFSSVCSSFLVSLWILLLVWSFCVSEGRMRERQMRTVLYPKNCITIRWKKSGRRKRKRQTTLNHGENHSNANTFYTRTNIFIETHNELERITVMAYSVKFVGYFPADVEIGACFPVLVYGWCLCCLQFICGWVQHAQQRT